MRKEQLTSPYDLVAEALGCDRETLTEESSILNHPSWESLTHAGIIDLLEKKYEIVIKDEDVMLYNNMKAIVELYNKILSSTE